MEEESNIIAGSEVEALKQTIADKDREIAELCRRVADTAGSVADSGQVPIRGEGRADAQTDGGDLRAEGQVGGG